MDNAGNPSATGDITIHIVNYPTSYTYGGSNARVDTDAERLAVVKALPDVTTDISDDSGRT